MAVETASDREFLLADFGVVVTRVSTSATFTAIFDNAYEAVDGGGVVPMAMVQPRIVARTADMLGLVTGETLTIEGVTYAVRVIMPDGTGMTEIMLEAQ